MQIHNKYFVLLLFLFFETTVVSQNHLHETKAITAKIIDAKTGSPVTYASIILLGTSKGTVSNTDGEFTFKIPFTRNADSLIIASMGYVNKVISVNDLAKNKVIKLTPAVISLSEIQVRPDDAGEIVMSALRHIKNNYPKNPYMVTAFYREIIKKRWRYLAVSEAVIDAYKASYSKILDNDRIKILKARKSTNIHKKDTVALKLKGGPSTMFKLDFVKVHGDILSWDVIDNYNFNIAGFTVIDNKVAYIINFVQKPEINLPLYEGKIYISMEDMAFAGAEFQVNKERISQAAKYMVSKKPSGVNVNIERATYSTKYRYYKGKWYLSYTKNEMVISLKWKKRHFRSKYSTVAELAVTDIDTINIIKYKRQNTVSADDVFIEKVDSYKDPYFWGDYNIIRPEEPIQSAIKRMGRKLKRRSRK